MPQHPIPFNYTRLVRNDLPCANCPRPAEFQTRLIPHPRFTGPEGAPLCGYCFRAAFMMHPRMVAMFENLLQLVNNLDQGQLVVFTDLRRIVTRTGQLLDEEHAHVTRVQD